jgi:branched-chain amino acid aminotransferase
MSRLIIEIMLKIWQLTKASAKEIQLPDMASLDAVTRQLPEGYYSTFRTFDGCTRVLGLSDHLRRLYEPVSTPDVSESLLRRQLFAWLEPYRPDEARVRLIMTKQGQTYIASEPLKRLPREVYAEGVRVETVEMWREDPQLKSTAFIGVSAAERKHIAREGIFEALLVKDGEILEGMTSNFFYVQSPRAARSPRRVRSVAETKREAILGTAREDILLGITRQTVIEIAQGRGLAVRYQPLGRDQLSAADEAFITSSSRGIVPVIQIDDVTIGQGSPGPITRQLSTAYEASVIEKAERILPAE